MDIRMIFVTGKLEKTKMKYLWLLLIYLVLMFYFIKGCKASPWGSEDLNFGGNNLVNTKFANIGGEVKFIDTLKYYQRSLGELASTLND